MQKIVLIIAAGFIGCVGTSFGATTSESKGRVVYRMLSDIKRDEVNLEDACTYAETMDDYAFYEGHDGTNLLCAVACKDEELLERVCAELVRRGCVFIGEKKMHYGVCDIAEALAVIYQKYPSKEAVLLAKTRDLFRHISIKASGKKKVLSCRGIKSLPLKESLISYLRVLINSSQREK